MFRDSIGAWRRKALLNRIVSAHNRSSGVRPRWRLSDKAKRSVLLAGVTVLGVGYLAGPSWLTGWRVEAQQRSEPPRQAACVIKGNVSDRGERIYHVPGGAFYNVTRINPAKGERWFCTEAEARQAGWRRSLR